MFFGRAGVAALACLAVQKFLRKNKNLTDTIFKTKWSWDFPTPLCYLPGDQTVFFPRIILIEADRQL
jgi:hypothetical protein